METYLYIVIDNTSSHGFKEGELVTLDGEYEPFSNDHFFNGSSGWFLTEHEVFLIGTL